MDSKQSIFFLSLLVVVTSVTLAPYSFAEIEKGKNYDKEVLETYPDGSQKIKFTTTNERIQDSDGTYKDFIITEFSDYFAAESKYGSVTLNKNTCSFNFHNKGYISENPIPLFTDSIISRVADYGTDNWNNLGVINNATCEAYWDDMTNSLVAKKYVANIGLVEYKYIWNDSWKTQLEVTNLSSFTNKKFSFIQTIDLYQDTIRYGGAMRNLDNFDGASFDRAWVENNSGRIINLLNGYHFDFDLGFENLWGISVYDIGPNASRLAFDYSKDMGVILPGQTLIIDPTLAQTADEDKSIREDDNDNVCEDTGSSSYTEFDKANELFLAYVYPTAAGNDCERGWLEFDISGLSSATSISDSYIDLKVDIAVPGGDTVDIYSMPNQPTTLSASDAFDQVNDGTIIVSATTDFQSTGDTITTDLTSAGDAEILAAVQASQSWFGLGFKMTDETLGVTHRTLDVSPTEEAGSDPQLTVIYTTIPNPDAVDDLTSTDIADTTVDLSWTQPSLNTGNLTGYQINYSTPWTNDPSTIIENNTGTSDTTSQITGLAQLQDYSFRVGIWTEGKNMTGNVLNITTLEDFALANFTPGFFDVNATNNDIIQIFFERQDINSTALFLNVTYPNTYSLACDFEYEFANTNQTYRNLDNVTISATAVESSFLFVDVDNEIINVYCWDESNANNDGSYLISQTSFPLLEQITNFRSGEYGTDGAFGAIDFITLAVVIVSMIGFNRINESVGAVFNIILLGAFAYFEIIELPTIIFGAIAVVLVLVITSTRKV